MSHVRGQPDLFAARGDSSRRPQYASRLVDPFLTALRGRGWVAGALISRELGADLRTLRAAAHESRGHILGGNRGYCRTLEAPLEDVTRVVNRLGSQAAQMWRRGMEIERVRHGHDSLGGSL